MNHHSNLFESERHFAVGTIFRGIFLSLAFEAVMAVLIWLVQNAGRSLR